MSENIQRPSQVLRRRDQESLLSERLSLNTRSHRQFLVKLTPQLITCGCTTLAQLNKLGNVSSSLKTNEERAAFPFERDNCATGTLLSIASCSSSEQRSSQRHNQDVSSSRLAVHVEISSWRVLILSAAWLEGGGPGDPAQPAAVSWRKTRFGSCGRIGIASVSSA